MQKTRIKRIPTPTDNGKKDTKKELKSFSILIPELKINLLEIELTGDSPLIINRFSEKARRMIAEKQQGTAVGGRENREPEKEYEGCFYGKTKDGGFLFPAGAFKNCAVTTCASLKHVLGYSQARQSHHIVGEVRNYIVVYGEAEMVEDTVRLKNGSGDLRYRPYIKDWSTTIKIRYNALIISPAQLVNLYNLAGFAVGVGDWRPEKDGSFGMFHVNLEGKTTLTK